MNKKQTLRYALTAVGFLSALLPLRAFAWDADHCDIHTPEEFIPALVAYQFGDPVGSQDRSCTKSIRFMNPMTIALDRPLFIDALPPEDQAFGTAFRKCVSSGPNAEPGCSAASATDVTFDLRGITFDDGRCPVRVATGARVDFINVRFLVRNAAAAVCTQETLTPIPQEDIGNEAAYLHNVTVIDDTVPPPTCSLTASAASDGYDLAWNTQGAASARLLREGTRIVLSTDLNASRFHVTPSFYATVYTLRATSGAEECMVSVTVPGRVRPLNRRYSFPFLFR